MQLKLPLISTIFASHSNFFLIMLCIILKNDNDKNFIKLAHFAFFSCCKAYRNGQGTYLVLAMKLPY